VLKELLSNEVVVVVALILAPFAFEVFAALFGVFRNFLRRKLPANMQAMIDEAAERGAVYAEQVAKSTMAKREDKLNMAVDVALRYLKDRYRLVVPRELVVESIEVFLGYITMKSEELIKTLG
jgi:hypothetical protein